MLFLFIWFLIVCSGESGSGKTETTKKVLQFISALTAISHESNGVSLNDSTISSGVSCQNLNSIPIEERVQYTSPLLESFGNSKTSKNDNSSRFGKWLEIMFEVVNPLDTSTFVANNGLLASGTAPKDIRRLRRQSRRRASSAKLDIMTASIHFSSQHLRLAGASITQYLLEKSRVVQQSPNERNYHIFYQLVSDPGASLGSPQNYRFLSQAGCTTLTHIDDSAEFAKTMAAFDNLNFSVESRTSITSALKAILYLGNIDFRTNSDGNYSAVDGDILNESAAINIGTYIVLFTVILTNLLVNNVYSCQIFWDKCRKVKYLFN